MIALTKAKEPCHALLFFHRDRGLGRSRIDFGCLYPWKPTLLSSREQVGVPWELPIRNSSAMQGDRVRNGFLLRAEPTLRCASPITRLPRRSGGSPCCSGATYVCQFRCRHICGARLHPVALVTHHIAGDLFRRHDVSGLGKLVWGNTVDGAGLCRHFCLSFSASRGMAERDRARMTLAREELRHISGPQRSRRDRET